MFSRQLLLLFAAFLACCLLQVNGLEVPVHVHVYQHDSARIVLNGLENFLWATLPGESTPIYGVQTKPSTVSFKLKVGASYRFHTRQPSFYHFSSEDVRIEPSLPGSFMFIEFPIVPVSAGITMVNLERSSFKTGAFSNITFPNGVFHFNFSSRFSNFRPHSNVGLGNPPAKFSNTEMVRFSALSSGLYSFYVEARPSHHSLGSIASFTNVRGQYALFAGEDPVTGHKATFTSQHRQEINWHIGDLVVTTHEGCITYQWADVNSYASLYGAFDNIVPRISRPALLQECLKIDSSVGTNSTGLNSTGCTPGFNSTGCSSPSFNSTGSNSTSPNPTGFNSTGFDAASAAGFNTTGFNCSCSPGFNSTGSNATEFDCLCILGFNSTKLKAVVSNFTCSSGFNSTGFNCTQSPGFNSTTGSNSTGYYLAGSKYTCSSGFNSTGFNCTRSPGFNSTTPTNATGFYLAGSNFTCSSGFDSTGFNCTRSPGVNATLSNSTGFNATGSNFTCSPGFNSTGFNCTRSPGSNSTAFNSTGFYAVASNYTCSPGSNSTGFNSTTGFNFTCSPGLNSTGSNYTGLNLAASNSTGANFTCSLGSNSTGFNCTGSPRFNFTGFVSSGFNCTCSSGFQCACFPGFNTTGFNSTGTPGWNSTRFNLTCLLGFHSDCKPGSLLSWILYQFDSWIQYLFY